MINSGIDALLCILVGCIVGMTALAALRIANPERLGDMRAGVSVPSPAEIDAVHGLNDEASALRTGDEIDRHDCDRRAQIESRATPAEIGDVRSGPAVEAGPADDVQWLHDESVAGDSAGGHGQ